MIFKQVKECNACWCKPTWTDGQVGHMSEWRSLADIAREADQMNNVSFFSLTYIVWTFY